jgi:hypothetical protein|tara:strand:- start:8415 stop:9626 length:1212 start_codon:yes stop_codon:yes gene_type:complete
MASTYTPLGIELQATGENSGTWGNKTNVNLQVFEQISGGFSQQSIAGGAGTTTLSIADSGTGDVAAHRMIEFTGSITGNRIVTIPLDVQTFYFLRNSTSGAYTVQFKYVSGSGSSVTFSATDKGDKIVFATANDGTNPDIKEIPMIGAVVDDTTPQLGGQLDVNGNALGDGTLELLKFSETGSAVNEFTVANAATGNGPTLSSTGDDSNVDININPKGTGVLKSGSAAVKIAGKETMWIPASAMYAATTNGAEAAQAETTATRPDMKTLNFDASTDEFAQFSVAMPKSWNEGTITYQVYWTSASTNTGNVIWGLQGVAVADNDTIDVAYGTAVTVTDAGIGTAEDQHISSESGAVTVAGSPAAGELSYFQVFRDANDGSDTFSADAKLLGVKIFFTTDAANDA